MLRSEYEKFQLLKRKFLLIFDLANAKLGIIGLGYVGLPLAVKFGMQPPYH